MGYRIEYNEVGNYPKRLRKRGKGLFVCILVLLLVLGAMTVKMLGLEWVQEVLIPGDPQITAAALEGVVEDIRNGESVIDAVKAFCQEIISHASSFE